MLARYVSFSLSLALSISRFKPFIKDKCFLPLQSCGVDYEVKAYIAKEADDPDEKISKKYVLVECHKFHTTVQYMPFAVARNQIIVYSDGFLPLFLSPVRDTCRLIIRKIQFAPGKVGAGPKADISKNFMMSDKPVHLEASIEKEVGL